MDKKGDRSQDELAGDGVAESSAHSRRDFLKKAAGVALSLPAAGAVVGSATAAPRVTVKAAAQPYAGVTLQFAKAPFGNDESDVISKLLAPFEKTTGIKVVHTVIPWNTEGATYATNYAGPNPYDVSYQTSTDLTGLGTKGVLEVLNTSKWLERTGLRLDQGEVHPGRDPEEHVPGQALRPSVHHRRHGRLLQQGPAGEGRRHEHPDQHDADGRRCREGHAERRLGRVGLPDADDRQGLQLVLPVPQHPQSRDRHHLQGRQVGHLHLRRATSPLSRRRSTCS